jgi:uncharacterized membrane protein
MSDSTPQHAAWSPRLLQGMAAAIGIELSDERAAALATQAEPHFALLRALDDIADPTTEPAAEFRLDDWTRRADG